MSAKKYFAYICIHAAEKTMHDWKQTKKQKTTDTAAAAATAVAVTATETMQSVNFLIYLISFDNLYSFLDLAWFELSSFGYRCCACAQAAAFKHADNVCDSHWLAYKHLL